MDYIAVIAQIATSAATLAVAIFLASQLRLQHRDSAESTRTDNKRDCAMDRTDDHGPWIYQYIFERY